MATQMHPIKKIPDKGTARGPGASIPVPKPEPRKCCLIGNQSTHTEILKIAPPCDCIWKAAENRGTA